MLAISVELGQSLGEADISHFSSKVKFEKLLPMQPDIMNTTDKCANNSWGQFLQPIM